MAYNYLEENDLADALNDSEVYMRDWYVHIPELQRITRGQPGKIPKGKPRVTDGTLASIRREKPKQVIQQLPVGRVTIYDHEDMEDNANAILTDIIIPNANSGGVPYSKAKRAIKSTIDVGSAWAYCFMNRTGSIFHADYKLKYYRDIYFEKGKVSEFDTNYMPMVEWLTEGDLKAIIWYEQQRKLTKTNWDLKALQELLDKGPGNKDQESKDPAEKKASSANGYFKLVYFFQKGVDANFYIYAPTIKKTVRKWVTKDPRGIIPIHGLIPEDDDDNPLGEALSAISAGKQNLLDFDMQMYQYGQALQYSPPIKKWGTTPSESIKLIPDNVIEMEGNHATDDFESVQIANQAIANFGNNAGLIKTQIQSEMGHRSDSSVSSTAGNPQFSKTTAGVQQGQQVTDISNNDLLVCYEQWQGRIFATCLSIQFAESQGQKSVQFERSTLKRLKLDKQPTIDYSKDYGKINFTVTANTSKKLSDAEQVQNMTQADALMTPQNAWQLAQIGWKLDIGEFQKAKFTRMNIDSIDKFLTKMDEQEATKAKQQPFPIIDAPQFRMNSADMTPEQIAAILANGGVQPTPVAPGAPLAQVVPGQPPAGLSAQGQADFMVEWLKAQTEAQAKQAQIEQNGAAQAIDTATKVDKHVHDTALALSDHVIKHTTTPPEPTATHKSGVEGEPANV